MGQEIKEGTMAPVTVEKLNTYLKIFAVVIGLLCTGFGSWYAQKEAVRDVQAELDKHIAVDTQDAIHTKETLTRIENNIKDIKAWLMKSPP
jgi:hypothetical protein